jgi:two-component system response regulator MprA
MPAVLIVDDDPKLLKMLQRTLHYESQGLNVFTATDGLEALQLVQVHNPDLIISDWMMLKMDGLDLVHRLRDEEYKTMILMLTARDAIDDRVDGLESSTDDYLVKPFAPAELVARVHARLRRVEAKPENQKVSYTDVTLDPSTREAKRGDIKVESELGKGSTVVLQFHAG